MMNKIKKIIKILIPKFILNTINNILRRIHIFLSWSPWINYSYSQEGEDMVLQRIFAQKEYGFYIDVGAHHPKRFSNTYLFYKKGWRGINIDALPGSMDLFNKVRPNDINLEVGIGYKEEELNYYMFNESALNSFSKKLSQNRDKAQDSYFIKNVIKVGTKTIE